MSSNLIVSPAVETKITKRHKVTIAEVLECFSNKEGNSLEDTRSEHLTDPITKWFIAETNHGRRLKICFMILADAVELKTAYQPNPEEERIYKKYALK